VFDSYSLENWIALGTHHRIAMHCDEGSYPNPIEEQAEEMGMWTLRASRGYNPLFHAEPELVEGIREVVDGTEADNYGDVQNEVIEYLEAQGLVVLPVALRGYSQSEWMDTLIWMRPDPEFGGEPYARTVLEHAGRDLHCWFVGDVYVLGLEELVTYHGPNGKQIDRWEPVDGVYPLHGNYFYSRPMVSDILARLEIDPAKYGVSEQELELAK